MKKMISIAIALVMVLALAIPAVSSAADLTGKTMWVYCSNGGELNFRRAASTDSPRIRMLKNGTKVSVIEDLGNGWVQIKAGNIIGYAQAKYLQARPLTKYQVGEKASSIVAVSPYMVTAKALNSRTDRSVGLREKPTKACHSIRRLEAGDQLEVIARGSVWSQVVDMQTGRTGYVANDYIEAA